MAEVFSQEIWESAGDVAPSTGVLGGLLGAYQEQGYEWGYRRGVADVLGTMLLLTEQYIRQQPGDPNAARRLLHGFEACLESHFQRNNESGFVSDGLGI